MSEIDRRAGFTLLEIVLAMTALALLTAVCYGAFHLAIRAIERGEMAVTTAQRLRATSDVLRQIRSTMYRLERNKEGDSFPYFRGTATSLSFDTNLRLQGGGGVTRVSYQVLDNPDWRLLPQIRNLEEKDRRKLQEDIGETLFLAARATFARGVQDTTHPRQEDLLLALDLTRSASDCFEEDKIPQALWQQQAELLKRLGIKPTKSLPISMVESALEEPLEQTTLELAASAEENSQDENQTG